MKARCRFCGDSVDTDAPGVYQYVKGWERRRPRAAVRLAERVQLWACHACIEALATGKANQPTLF